MIILCGRLPETENKTKCQISGLKSGRLREFLKQYLTDKQNGYLQSGRLREVVTMRELTVLPANITKLPSTKIQTDKTNKIIHK